MTPGQVIVLAMPVFLVAIGLEVAVGLRRGRNTYNLADALSSLSLGLMFQLVGLFTKVFGIGLYTWAYQNLAWQQLPATALWVWLTALLLYDFCYYWLHRAGHRVAWLWAAHVVHHQSEEYNLSTALRQTGTGWLGAWVFYLPMALLGFPPLVFATVALIDLLYQFWVHTRQVGRLGWFDRWFCSPSNHSVHHAVNDRYLDKNYGGILMVWDRWFGTFVEEDDLEPIVYGTRAPLRSLNPLWANLAVYAALARDSWHAKRWADKLRVWWMPPSWRPDDVARRYPLPAFDLHRPHFAPVLSARQARWGVALFALALGASAALLWQAPQWPGTMRLGMAGAIAALLWHIGRMGNSREAAAR